MRMEGSTPVYRQVPTTDHDETTDKLPLRERKLMSTLRPAPRVATTLRVVFAIIVAVALVILVATRTTTTVNETDRGVTTCFSSQKPSMAELARNAVSHGHESIDWDENIVLDKLINRWWYHNYLCKVLLGGSKEKQLSAYLAEQNPPVLLNISFGCTHVFHDSEYGTGNFIWAFYSYRLSAQMLGFDVQIYCPDAWQERGNLILPWMTGYFPARPHLLQAKPTERPAMIDGVCGSSRTSPVGYMLDDIRYEIRRMTVALVGIPSRHHPSAEFANDYLGFQSASLVSCVDQNATNTTNATGNVMQVPSPTRDDPPLLQNFEMDDVIIHFRCGDLMNSTHANFGFVRFHAYAQLISPESRFIGIVTQPFNENDLREVDQGTGRRCRIVVTDLVDYLQEKFPKATIRIHNKHEETITMTYARLVMASQTIVSPSSFGVFAALGSFGMAYIFHNETLDNLNFLLLPPMTHNPVSDIVLRNEEFLLCSEIKDMWEQDPTGAHVLSWFRSVW